MKLKHRGVILLQLFMSQRGCEVWLWAWCRIREITSSGLKTWGKIHLQKAQQLLIILSTPTCTLATLSTSRALWIKSCHSFWRQDLNADAKARPYSSFFSRECSSRFRSQNLLPQDVHWQTAGSLCSAACLEILVYQGKNTNSPPTYGSAITKF